MRSLFAFGAGSLFGLGLLVSGMTDTAKVQGFLDFFGAWDATLVFVLVAALVPMTVAWRMTAERAPALGGTFPKMPDPKIGKNIAIGSALFGVGWGLSGLCPGPSLASVSWGGTNGLIFLAAMIAGMLATPMVRARLDGLGATG